MFRPTAIHQMIASRFIYFFKLNLSGREVNILQYQPALAGKKNGCCKAVKKNTNVQHKTF